MHDAILAELRAQWPSLSISPDGLEDLLTNSEGLTGAHRGDLLLAWACLGGVADALAVLEQLGFEPAGMHARSTGLPAPLVDDALQLARIRLLLNDADKPPALRSYRGRGPLGAFVRTVVLRIAIDLQRHDREDPSDQLEMVLAGMQPDPELQYMRKQYAAELRAALRSAWHGLPAHERFILGLYLHEKLDLDAIAAVYQVHRATAARRTATARATLVSLTRAALQTSLSVGTTTVDSILRIVATSLVWSALEPVADQ